MPRGGPERLLVYRRACNFANDVRAAVVGWPAVDEWSAGIQLIRAADSVGANIAEATGRSTLKDQMRSLITARGSVYEVQQWLVTAYARDLPLPDDATCEADEIGRMLNGLIQSTASRISS